MAVKKNKHKTFTSCSGFSPFIVQFNILATSWVGIKSDDIISVKHLVVKMMIIVVCLFVLCWLPLQIYNLLDNTALKINEYLYINIIWFSSNWLAMSNSCYNPFIYGLLNEKFKREFRQLFAHMPCWKTSGEHYTEYYSEDANIFRRANNNGNCSANRHGATRYNFYREEKKVYIKQCQVPADETETSNI